MGHLTFIESVNIPRKMCHKSEISRGVGGVRIIHSPETDAEK